MDKAIGKIFICGLVNYFIFGKEKHGCLTNIVIPVVVNKISTVRTDVLLWPAVPEINECVFDGQYS